MTMIQKGIYLCFLVIGISSVLLFLYSSCNGDPPDPTFSDYNWSYCYINHSARPIQMMIYNSSDELVGSHKIEDGDTLFATSYSTNVIYPPLLFNKFEDKTGDSIYLNFASERYLTYSKKQEDDIFEFENYRHVTIAPYKFIFCWEFTEKNYENATVIEP